MPPNKHQSPFAHVLHTNIVQRDCTLNYNFGRILFFHLRLVPARLCQEPLHQCIKSLSTDRFGNGFQGQLSDKVLNGLHIAWGIVFLGLNHSMLVRWAGLTFVQQFLCISLSDVRKTNSAQSKVQSTRQLSAVYFQEKKKSKLKHLMFYPKIFLNLEGYAN